MSRARSALSAAAVGAVLVLLAAVPLTSPAGGVEAARSDAGTVTCTTNSDGYCTIPHSLAAVPVSVVVTVKAPVAGTWIAGQVDADAYTAGGFRVRVFRRDGEVWRSRQVTVAYLAAAGPAVETTEPAPSTEPAVTTPATTTGPPGSTPAPSSPAATFGAGEWPTAATTGPTVPLTLHSGDLTVTTPGAVVSGLDIRGCVSVQADHVTIRNARITCADDYQVRNFTSSPWRDYVGTVLEDVEIDCAGQLENKAVAFSGYTARRVHVHNCGEGFHVSDDVTIEDSLVELAGGPESGPHYDGVQSDGGSNVHIVHNRISNPHGQTSAILMSTNTAPISDVWVTNNLLAGGGYTLYCGTDSGGVTGNFHATGNRWLRSPAAQWGPTTSCSGVAEWSDNTWTDGTPVPR